MILIMPSPFPYPRTRNMSWKHQNKLNFRERAFNQVFLFLSFRRNPWVSIVSVTPVLLWLKVPKVLTFILYFFFCTFHNWKVPKGSEGEENSFASLINILLSSDSDSSSPSDSPFLAFIFLKNLQISLKVPTVNYLSFLFTWHTSRFFMIS